ncbi:putative ABC transport system substrate-binding protein [Oribacterium sp. KHPX15]|uniref:ABC transporter substrate-binding protein n=1 Tax=Oribacterium sp. KHPX15 TaxID=1855342 RepID=UPI00089B6678|nr:ABC transporter substrate-binding protein [Oribacterium sp. KHPX15]SDZ86781.1 putative ABC transport system substrate-binding protein [Oribacterium sp. KHPX15]
MKKQLIAASMAVLIAASLMGCSSNTAPEATSGAAASEAAATDAAGSDTSKENADADSADKKDFKVGIVLFMDHPSLNQIKDNVASELDKLSGDMGVTFNYADYTFNGQGDATVLNQIASELISDEVDVIIPIATPAAQVVQAAVEDKGIPVVFSAVSDPVTAKLVSSMETPGSNITGTSDALNTNAIMDLMFAVNPETDYVGLLYSNSEDASKQPIEDAKKYLDDKGIKYIEKTGTKTDEIQAAADALVAEGVDAVFTPTDNTIQQAELGIYEKFQDAKIAHYAGADSFALNGAFMGYGVDYSYLGVATADMVADILVNGNDVATTSVQTFDNGIATINTDTCEVLGLNLDDVKKAIEPLCTQIVETKTEKEFSK